ncbi:MAG: methyltransferase domain-containing protein [Nitrospirae bacterium]|nr:MAG: methyltransferase domain-containing protein [Nitrospirota bacterium]
MKNIEACPACDCPDSRRLVQVVTEHVSPADDLVYLHCGRCGLVYSHRQFEDSAELDECYAAPYQEAARAEFLKVTAHKTGIHRYRKAWLDATLRRLAWSPRHKRALEIGSKDGSFLKLIRDDGWEAVGMDPNATYGRLAKEVYGVEIRSGYFEQGTFPPATFDLVSSFHVIEHIQDPNPVLTAVRDVLTPGGLLYLETPNLHCLQRRQLATGHVVLYSLATLAQVLEHNGFEVVAVSENGPGGLLTFDQVAVLARATGRPAGEWRLGESFEEAKACLERALQSNFPSPEGLSFRNRMFHLVQRLFGDERALALKSVYLGVHARRRGQQMEKAAGGPAMDLNRLPDPVRQQFLQGFLQEGHLRELQRLPDEWVQLKVLARIKVFRLSHDQTKALVDAELSRAQEGAFP